MRLDAARLAERQQLRPARITPGARWWSAPPQLATGQVQEWAPQVLYSNIAFDVEPREDPQTDGYGAFSLPLVADGLADGVNFEVRVAASPGSQLLAAIGHEPGSWSWSFEETSEE